MSPKRVKYFLINLICLACICVLCGCARYTEIPLHSVKTDIAMGKELSSKITLTMGIYEDPDLTPYVENVCERIAKGHKDQRFEYKAAIVDSPVVNAFALPGGYLYVSRGILAATNNEAEIGHIIGHEIIHISRRHAARSMARAVLPGLLSLPGRIVGAVLSKRLGDFINAPLSLTSGAVVSTHSRHDEFESDRFGQALAAKGGYNPNALPRILTRMEKLDEVDTGKKRTAGFFDTHPMTPDRTKRLTAAAAEMKWSTKVSMAGSPDNYLRLLDGLIINENPMNGLFIDKKFVHPVLDFSVTFPDDWETFNTPTSVIAVQPDKEALLVLKVAGKNIPAKEKAISFKQQLKREYGATPIDDREIKGVKIPAYLLTYVEHTKKEEMYMHFLWFEYGDHLYQLTAMGSDSYRPLLRKAALSFRPLQKDELASIKETRLRVISAKDNETLEELNKRSGNIWSLEYTGVINDIDPNQPLKNGRLVKIAVEEKYTKPM